MLPCDDSSSFTAPIVRGVRSLRLPGEHPDVAVRKPGKSLASVTFKPAPKSGRGTLLQRQSTDIRSANTPRLSAVHPQSAATKIRLPRLPYPGTSIRHIRRAPPPLR